MKFDIQKYKKEVIKKKLSAYFKNVRMTKHEVKFEDDVAYYVLNNEDLLKLFGELYE